jgi:hypothetical protein
MADDAADGCDPRVLGIDPGGTMTHRVFHLDTDRP